jgi:cysteine desulfurase family protein (TIGR01976 family)
VSFDPGAVRAQFPSLSITDHGVRRIYLDNPAGTQVPASVVQHMSDCLLQANANLGGFFRTSDLAGEFVDAARAASVDFLNAPSADEIIFGQNMTTLTLHLSRSIGRCLKAGDEIVLSRMDHDANVAPWLLMARDHGLQVRWLAFNTESFEFDANALDDVLTDRTRLVCVGGASNMTGTLNDVQALCAKIRAAGAWSYIDAVQSAPHELVDVQAIGCDFLVCSAYKFFGPHQSLLWGRRDVLQQLEPYRVRPAPADLPGCFETGTQNHEGIAGIGAAVDYFASIGSAVRPDGGRRQQLVAAFEQLFAYEKRLGGRLIAGLQAIPGVTVQGITAREALGRRVPTVSFTHATQHPDTIAKALAEQNIFVWSGHNYAVEPAKVLGLYDSGGVVRIGAVHYNTAEEIDATLTALEGILG